MIKCTYCLCLVYLALNTWGCVSSESDEGAASESCSDIAAECLIDRPAVQTNYYQIKLLSLDPNPPERGENTWRFKLNSADSQESLTGCEVTLVPYMPEHGHGSPKEPEFSELGGGEYEFSDIVFTMPGLWSMGFDVSCGDFMTEQVFIDFIL